MASPFKFTREQLRAALDLDELEEALESYLDDSSRFRDPEQKNIARTFLVDLRSQLTAARENEGQGH